MSAIRRKVVTCRDAWASRRLRHARLLLAAATGLILRLGAPAQSTLYWDTNGSTSGAGSTPTGTWSGGAANWTTNAFGTATTAGWTSGANAVFSAGFDATNAFTVTVAGMQNLSSLTVSMGSPTFTGGTLNFNDTTPDLWTIVGTTATISSVIAGTNGLTKTGAGTAILDGSAKSYTGATTVNGGTFQLNASNILSNSSALAVGAGGTFLLNWGISETMGALSGGGIVDLRTGALTIGDASSTTFSGTIQDSYGSLIKQGTGTLTLSGNSTYTGITTINAGAIIAASNSALGGATSGNIVASGAALQLQGGITLTETSFTVTGTGVGSTGALRNLSGDNTLAAAVTLGGNTTVASDAGTFTVAGQSDLGSSNILTVSGAGNTTLSGAITGGGALAKSGTGTLTLGGAVENSFSGGLNLNDGTVILNKSAGISAGGTGAINVGDGTGAAGSAVLRLGASNQIADYGGTLTVKSDGLFDLNGQTEAVNVIAGSGRIDLGTTGALTIGANSGSSTFGGSLLGTGSFTKAGSGILDITTNLTFNGTFTLAGGTLRLSDIVLNLATLNITGNSTIDFAGVDASLFVTNLTISAGVTLNVTNWTNAVDYFYAQNWSGAVTNTRNAAPMNQVVFTGFVANNTQWQGYDRQVTPVPEPAAGGALLVSSVAALVAWRRRRA